MWRILGHGQSLQWVRSAVHLLPWTETTRTWKSASSIPLPSSASVSITVREEWLPGSLFLAAWHTEALSCSSGWNSYFHIIKPVLFPNLPCHDYVCRTDTTLVRTHRPDSLPDTHGAGLGWAAPRMGTGRLRFASLVLRVMVMPMAAVTVVAPRCGMSLNLQPRSPRSALLLQPIKLCFGLFTYSTLRFSSACLFVSLKKKLKSF